MVEAHEAVGGATSRGKPDPNVVLPPAVKKAAERSEELARQGAEAKAKREAEEAANPQPTFAPSPTSAPMPSVKVSSFDPNNPNPPTEPVVTPESRRPGAATPPPATPTEAPPDLEHQFQSMKGRYEREAENNRRITRQLADMQHLMAAMQAAPPQPQPTSQQGSGVTFGAGPGQPRYVTPEEVKEYGEELIDIVGRRAREVYEPVVAQLTQELNNIKQQVGGVRNTVAYDASVKMYEELAKEVPNWEQINASVEFGRWLDQPDPLTGQIRRNILNYSHSRNMTGSVIAAFKGFLSDQASLGPANGGMVPGNGADRHEPVASTPQATLAQFAAPGRAKTGQTQVPPEKPIFSTADITQFYRDKTAGKYAGREAEADAYERQLYDAGREGRIRR